jgi:hypothetical protein
MMWNGVNSVEYWDVCWNLSCYNYWNNEEFLNFNRLKFAIIPNNKNMKLESIKILTGEIDYKLGRINYFKTHLEEWKNKEDEGYKKSQKRLAKLMDEASNLLQIMKLEELDEFKGYVDIFKKPEEYS